MSEGSNEVGSGSTLTLTSEEHPWSELWTCESHVKSDIHHSSAVLPGTVPYPPNFTVSRRGEIRSLSYPPASANLPLPCVMPFSPLANQSFLSKCGSTLFCYLRTVHLWLFVVLVLILGALRSRVARPRPSLQRKAAS